MAHVGAGRRARRLRRRGRDHRPPQHDADEVDHQRRTRPTSKEYGLDKPAATVRVTSGSAQAGLAIGKSAGDGVVYAKDLSRPMVFTVESALLDELKKPADDFRVKDLFDARAFNTTRIEITRNGQTAAFEKEKGKDDWKQTDAGGEGRRQRQGRSAADRADAARAPPSFAEARPPPVSRRPRSPSPSASKTARSTRRSPSRARAPTPSRAATATRAPRRSTPPPSTASSRRSTR